MRNFIFLVLSLLCFVLAGTEKVLVWETAAPGLPGKVYLTGSIHVGKKEWYPLDKTYDQVLEASSAVYFEISDPNPALIAQESQRYGMFPPGRTLSGVLGFADFQTVCAFFSRNEPNMIPMVLERIRPWLLNISLARIYLMKHPEFSVECGLEKVFSRHLGNRKAYSLETVESQFSAMAKVPDAAAGRMLLESIRDFNQAGRDLKRIMESLENGSPDNLTMITNEMAFKHPEYFRCLFLERNQLMTEKIYDLLKEKQTVMVLIGAGHFAGTGSILEYLWEKGCTTIQLKRTGTPGKIRPEQ